MSTQDPGFESPIEADDAPLADGGRVRASDLLPLAGSFEPASLTDWMTLADGVVGEANFEDVLVHHTAGHLRVDPLYDPSGAAPAEGSPTSEPGRFPYTRGAHRWLLDGRWDIRQRHDLLGDPAEVNRRILEDLRGGVTSILLRTYQDTSVLELEQAFADVHLDLIEVAFDAGPWVGSLSVSWAEMARRRSESPVGSPEPSGLAPFGALRRTDPIGTEIRFGQVGSADLNSVAGLAASPLWSNGLIGVDASVWTDRGADEVQELAWSLATAVSYLRILVDAEGWPIDRAARAVNFTYAATAEQFTTIAKLRAARRCWARIVTAAGGSPEAAAQQQHAITPESLFTATDPHSNLLRSSTAALAAVVGGASAITVLPCSTQLGQPDEFGRRTSRNIQLLLQEESHLGWVTDPAGGSWFIQDHTDDLANRAWAKFQEIELQGGMLAAVERGHVGAELSVRLAERRADERSRRAVRVGATHWVDGGSQDLPDLEPWPDPPDGLAPVWRPDAEFSSLRERVAARDDVQMLLGAFGSGAAAATLTDLPQSAMNAATVGFSVVEDLSSPEDAAAAWSSLAAAADEPPSREPIGAVICIARPDAVRVVPGVVRALRAAGCPWIAVGCDPGGLRSVWSQAGVDAYLYEGADIVAVIDHALGTSVSPDATGVGRAQ